jgi:hypothetical protein
MRVGEDRPLCGETVNVGCLHLWMSAEAADPIVLIVDGKKEDVRRFGCKSASNADSQHNQQQPSNRFRHPSNSTVSAQDWVGKDNNASTRSLLRSRAVR